VLNRPHIPDTASTTLEASDREAAQIARWLIPLLLTACVTTLSLRGAMRSDIENSDAARHATNGALIYDWIREGELRDPVSYATQYYAHLPATSIPYHPPMFPLVEAGLFALFGVQVVVARVAVAAFTAICVLLIYRRVVQAWGSSLVAVATVVTFFTLQSALKLSSDVMLEFPAFGFALASLAFLQLEDGQWRLRDGLCYALLGGMAVWTKQHTVFVGLVPIVYILLSRRWYLLRGKTFLISMAVFTLLVYALLKTTLAGGGASGTSQVLGSSAISTLSRTMRYYPEIYFSKLGIVPGSVCAVTFLFLLIKRLLGHASDRHDFMLSWVISVVAMVLVLKQFNGRYILYGLPPMIAFGYFAIAELCRHRLPERAVQAVVMVCLALVALPNIVMLTDPTVMLSGPGSAARHIVDQGARRVLYCGYFDGSFVFTVRSLGEPMQCWVLSGEKFDKSVFEPKSFKALIDDYGVEFVALENTDLEQPWDAMAIDEIPTLRLEKVFDLQAAQFTRACGSLSVYRNLSPSSQPADPTQLQISSIGKSYLGKYNDLEGLIETLNTNGDSQSPRRDGRSESDE